ncbi:Gfo/Idh/MocA family oxidoreductase [soil metagenome]
MINIGIVGYGYWGPNLARSFFEVKNSCVKMICDLSEEKLKCAQQRHPSTTTTFNFTELVENPEIDAIAIATPVQTHYDLALAALRAGKHVLLEKPMTETSEQAKHLIEEAAKRNLVLQVDHTFLFTPGVKKIHELMSTKELGEIYFYDATRVNLGLFRHDVSVIWDLAIHDLSILDYVLPDKPVAISATGTSHLRGSTENSAFITLFFDSPTIAHINVNWLSPVKLRQTLIGGSRKMIVFDDLQTSEKIKVYDRGVYVEDSEEGIQPVLKGYRMGDMWSPYLSTKEALVDEIEHFLDCINNNTTPISDGEMGLRMVQLLEMATLSMRERGAPIAIKNNSF